MRLLTATCICFIQLLVIFPALAESPSPPRGYFISIDGLRPDYLETMAKSGKLNAPRGLGWLYHHSVVRRGKPIVTTLTAASHVSNATCSPPSVHGIISNSFLKDGKMIDGYSSPLSAETLWQAARKQHRTVISSGYVGVDGASPERSVDYGISFPDPSLLGKELSLKLPGTHDGMPLSLTLNSKSGETVMIYLTIRYGQNPRVLLDDDTDLNNGRLAETTATAAGETMTLFFYEKESEELRLVKRRVDIRVRDLGNGAVDFYVFPASYTNAAPKSYRKFLDDHNLIWPPSYPDMKSVATNKKNEIKTAIDNFLAEATELAEKQFKHDIVAFYQLSIDSTGHTYEADLPHPFDPKRTDAVTQAYIDAFQLVDHNLSRVLSEATEEDVILLVGDHGMAPMKKKINAAILVPELMGSARVVEGGGLFLIYDGAQAGSGDIAGEKARVALTAFKDGTTAVLDQALRRADFEKQKIEWQYGDAVWALLSTPGYQFSASLTAPLWSAPSSPGMHGFAASHEIMDTVFVLKAPEGKREQLNRLPATVELLNAAPTFAALLDIPAPKDCRGKALP